MGSQVVARAFGDDITDRNVRISWRQTPPYGQDREYWELDLIKQHPDNHFCYRLQGGRFSGMLIQATQTLYDESARDRRFRTEYSNLLIVRFNFSFNPFGFLKRSPFKDKDIDIDIDIDLQKCLQARVPSEKAISLGEQFGDDGLFPLINAIHGGQIPNVVGSLLYSTETEFGLDVSSRETRITNRGLGVRAVSENGDVIEGLIDDKPKTIWNEQIELPERVYPVFDSLCSSAYDFVLTGNQPKS